MIDFKCPHCSHEIHVDDALAGRRGKCAKCGQKIDVPARQLVPALPNDRDFDSTIADALLNPTPPSLPPRQANVEACPDCNELVSLRARRCPHCGAPIAKHNIPQDEPVARYANLRAYGMICIACGWLLLALAVGAIVVGIVSAMSNRESLSIIAASFGAAGGFAVAAVPFLLVGNAILAFLAIEENTRASRESLRRLEWLMRDS